MSKLADSYVIAAQQAERTGQIGTEALHQVTGAALQAAAAIGGIGGGSIGAAMPVAVKGKAAASAGVMHSRDVGGPGIAGQPYMIGTGAQPEMFVPDTNGTFIPNADKKGGMGGTTYNIVVNNPKKETAENSIRIELKNLSMIGVAA